MTNLARAEIHSDGRPALRRGKSWLVRRINTIRNEAALQGFWAVAEAWASLLSSAKYLQKM